MSEMTIRRARSEDVGVLSDVAVRAKKHWGYPEHWIDAWRDELTVTVGYLRENRVYVAELQGDIVGFYALRDLGSQMELDHLWVDPAHIGHGYGKSMFDHAVKQAREHGVSEMSIDADPNAAGFYALMGAEHCGAVAASMDGIARERPQFRIRISHAT